MYNPTEQEITEATLKLIAAFGDLPGFPKNDTSLEMTARGFARIVWNLPISEIPNMEGREHPKLGNQNDADWIIGEFLETSDRFPPLITIRRLYENSLPPRDGRSASEMGA